MRPSLASSSLPIVALECWLTSSDSKTNTKNILGPSGVRDILEAMTSAGYGHVPTVCIGGVNESNLQRVLFQSGTALKNLDGVAVVSAIVSAHDPEAAARNLCALSRRLPAFLDTICRLGDITNVRNTVDRVAGIVKAVHEQKPLSHNMTNMVGSLLAVPDYSA